MRHRIALALLATLTLVAASCGGSSEPAGGGEVAEGAQQFESVTLASVNNMMHLPEYVAVERGFFAENGLNARLDILSSGADINKAMQSGNAEFGGISNTAAAAARAAGLPVKLVVPVMSDPTTKSYAGPLGVVGRKDRGIKASDPSSLIGKRVAVHEGSTNHEYLRLLLERHGIPESKVDIVPIESADQPVSLREGDVDAASDWEPFVSQMLMELGSNAVVVSRGDPLLGYTIGISSPESVITAKRDVIRKFAAAIAQAAHWVRQNKEEAAKIAPNFISGLDPAHALAAMEHLSFDPRISRCTVEAFDASSKSLAAKGEIKSAPSGEELVEPSIMQEVEREHPEWFEDLPPIPPSCR